MSKVLILAGTFQQARNVARQLGFNPNKEREWKYVLDWKQLVGRSDYKYVLHETFWDHPGVRDLYNRLQMDIALGNAKEYKQ